MEFQDLLGEGGDGSLRGQYLVAMPGIGDERFERAVILLVAHSSRGALGFVVNDPADVSTDELLTRAGIGVEGDDEIIPGINPGADALAVVHGGPVEASRGFVLHSPDYESESTQRLDQSLALTSTLDVLRAVARGRGPDRALLALGYAGWDAGQLEGELRENVWLTVEGDTSIVFDVPSDERYAAALGLLGVAPEALSGVAGNA